MSERSSELTAAVIERFESVDIPVPIEINTRAIQEGATTNISKEQTVFFEHIEAAFELSYLALQSVNFIVTDDIIRGDKTFDRSIKLVTELHLHDIQAVAAVVEEFRADGSYRARFSRYDLNAEALTLATEFQSLQTDIG